MVLRGETAPWSHYNRQLMVMGKRRKRTEVSREQHYTEEVHRGQTGTGEQNQKTGCGGLVKAGSDAALNHLKHIYRAEIFTAFRKKKERKK